MQHFISTSKESHSSLCLNGCQVKEGICNTLEHEQNSVTKNPSRYNSRNKSMLYLYVSFYCGKYAAITLNIDYKHRFLSTCLNSRFLECNSLKGIEHYLLQSILWSRVLPKWSMPPGRVCKEHICFRCRRQLEGEIYFEIAQCIVRELGFCETIFPAKTARDLFAFI